MSTRDQSSDIRIDLESQTPVYRQIADGIRSHLVEGGLEPGDKLPTVRTLARDLGVHHNTVAEAYRSLAAEGWLELGRRRGATVLRRETPSTGEDADGRFELQVRNLVAQGRADGISQTRIIEVLTNHIQDLKGQKPC